ncbi:hypothetical protein QAD02_011377 [Eretmocerus hayati]|uniref:Uncharacterized protein n=1 Tax=Eretmocerus hayati TaxID=131215 RepID=A0ACC2NWR5_9HYME|nr:hypothetical protein QAD02_011377 [Eretmocerus hayati]
MSKQKMRTCPTLLLLFLVLNVDADKGLNYAMSRAERSPIIGGKQASIEKYAFFVSLELVEIQVCGGSIITNQWVLTAAHCFDMSKKKDQYKIRSGATAEGIGGTKHRIESYEIRFDYVRDDRNLLHNDLALIRVKDVFYYDELRQPIKMFDFHEESPAGSSATIIGFSSTNQRRGEDSGVYRLTESYIRIFSKIECTSIWAKFKVPVIPKSTICAGADVRKDTCGGDSGGPLIIDGRLAGVTSFGRPRCAIPGVPAFYTEIAQFRHWIDSRTTFMQRRLFYTEIEAVRTKCRG